LLVEDPAEKTDEESLEEAAYMPRRKPKVLDHVRPPVSPAAAAALRFANTGIFQLADQPPIDSARVEPLEWLREYVHAQLAAVATGDVGDLDRVDCAASSQLHEYARRRLESLRRNPSTKGTAAASTEDHSVGVAVDLVRSTTTIGVRQLIPLRLRLCRCERAQCAHWFVADDVRRAFCSDDCQNLERPAEGAAYTRVDRQIPPAKIRA
jgi:hypothetical protein